jgi:Ca2+/H+ antiporter, TMEM165/GDT1 family
VVLAVVSSYVLAELGDKTMLATVALASDHNWAGVWIGATVAMVLADGLAIAAGALLHQRLPERLLHGLASALFVLFGLWLLFDTALGWPWVAVVATGSAAVLAAAVAVAAPLRARGALARGYCSKRAGRTVSKLASCLQKQTHSRHG